MISMQPSPVGSWTPSPGAPPDERVFRLGEAPRQAENGFSIESEDHEDIVDTLAVDKNPLRNPACLNKAQPLVEPACVLVHAVDPKCNARAALRTRTIDGRTDQRARGAAAAGVRMHINAMQPERV